MASNIERIAGNVQKMLAQGAPEADVQGYLRTEGFTPDRFISSLERFKQTGGIERPGNAARAAAQGLTLGFADEAEAAVRSALGQGTYNQNLTAIRGGLQDYGRESPVTSTVAELGGAVIPAVAGLLAAPFTGGSSAAATATGVARAAKAAPTLMNQVGRGAAIGAGTGGVAGFGSSEGGFSNRLEGAMKGAGFGAAVGGAVPVAMAGGRSVVEKAKDVVGRSGASAERKADELVMKSLERDNITPQDLAARAQANAQFGVKPETIADLGGANTRGRLAAAANVPGTTKDTAKEFMQERVRGQGERLIGDLEGTMGQRLEDTNRLANTIIEARAADAAPMYQAAYAKGAYGIDDSQINRYLQLPYFKQAYARAQRIAELEGRELPQIYRLQTDDAGRMLRDADGLPIYGDLEKLPNLQTLDYIKRGLDDAIGTGTAKGSLGRTEIGALKKIKNEFLNRVDEIAPEEYKQARKTFAGYTEAKEAIDMGRGVFNMPENDWRDIANQFRNMSELEQQMFRRGVVDASRIELDRSTRQYGAALDVTKVFDNKQRLERLRQVFPDDESFNLFKQNLKREAQFAQTRNDTISGSRTAPLAADVADSNGLMPSASELGSLSQGNVMPAITGGISRAIGGRMQGITGDVADALGDRLVGLRTPQEIAAYANQLLSRQNLINDELTRRATTRGLLSGGAGNLTGQGLSVEEQPFPPGLLRPY